MGSLTLDLQASLVVPLQLQSTIVKWCTKNAGVGPWIKLGSLENSRGFISIEDIPEALRDNHHKSNPVVKLAFFDWIREIKCDCPVPVLGRFCATKKRCF